ncbi:Satratoxin biosynthesis SC3 cluster transcription factor SAT20-like protein [Cladobotryum mycophilum]|uniref:Satratoxin biosynthesis SC3 cluster transcription factor SAT20-like protein n=1 Tax=Cladobotryum mycophilum TaxID=491253 RepID=A0ABR0SFY3_9HYPO
MELQQTFHHKRPLAHTGFDVPGPSIPIQFPFVDFTYTPFLSEYQLFSPIQETVTYGQCSSFHDISQEFSQKRRRIDNNYIPMSQEQQEFVEDYQEKLPASDGFQHHANSAGISGWVTPAAVGRQLSKILCPCCAFGHPHGYHHISENPVSAYDPGQPYVMQDPPSMAIQPVHHQVTPNQESPQHLSFSGDHPISSTPPLIAYPVLDPVSLPPQPPPQLQIATVPTTVDEGDYHQIQPSTEYYSDHLVKQEPQLSSPIVFSAVSQMNSDQSPTSFGHNLIHDPNYLPLIPQNTEHSGVYTQYEVVPLDGLPQAVPLDGWSEMIPHTQESNFDILLPNQRGGKRGPFRDQNLREQTAQTRKIGSCIRCRMQRIRCEHNPDDPAGGCMTCKKVANTRAGRFPCLRYKITDVRLYKPGQVPGYEWTRRWNNNISDPIQKWASAEIKVIYISEGFTNRNFQLRVRKFVSQEGDKLNRTWDYNGTTKSVAIPPYALMDLEDAKVAYNKHIGDSMIEILRTVLNHSEGILYKTYLQAWRMMRDPTTPSEAVELLTSTLRLWASIRMSTTSVFIVGEETLGMPNDILDETSPSPGKIPVPPVLGAQMDLILIHHIQTRLRRELLDKLQKMVLKNKQSCWLVTYIVTFILLHNASLITAHDASYARKHGMKRRFAREDKVQEYHLGANILLAHFHYCNKGVHPFSDDCKDQDLRTLADLDEDKIQFVRATRAFAKQHKQDWEELRVNGACESDYYFVSQLFEEGWQPRPTVL